MHAVRRDAERRDLAGRVANETDRRPIAGQKAIAIERHEHEIFASWAMDREPGYGPGLPKLLTPIRTVRSRLVVRSAAKSRKDFPETRLTTSDIRKYPVLLYRHVDPGGS